MESPMSPRPCSWAARVLGAASLAAIVPAALASSASRFAPLSTWDAATVERARTGAARRLEVASCQRVLSDFKDPQGRTLLANLEPWGEPPADYLRQAIMFLDGSTLPECRKGSVPLVTSRGQPVVFVCPAGGSIAGSRFARVQAENATLAEAMVIHEMMHTLGLGENPPTTFEITDRVMARCR